MPTDDAAVFTLTISGGLADRNRLPIDQVVRTLQEFQELVREIGKRVQRDAGVSEPNGDFGLEIVAGSDNSAFRKGSIKATAVATRDVQNAVRAFSIILGRAKEYSRKPIVDDAENGVIARRMFAIAKLQAPAKSLVAFTLRGGALRVQKASLNEKAFVHLQAARKRMMTVESLQLYGRLRQLNDRSKTDKSDGHFWGELLADSGDIWRLRFESEMLSSVLPLFMGQVMVTGNATYFGPARNPRLIVKSIDRDLERNYVKSFDALRKSGTKIFGDATTDELLAELYG